MTEETPATTSPTEETPATTSPTEETPATTSPTEETPATTSPTEETPATTSPTEQSPPEPTAKLDFISWTYPPYCELCSVVFSGESVSKTHFEGAGHKGKLHTWKKYQENETPATTSKTVLCKICWKEMNTQKILDDHNQSPVHLKKEKECLVVQRLKEDYRKLRESQS